VFSAHISTGDRVFTEISIHDADSKYISGLGRLIGDLGALLRADAERRRYAAAQLDLVDDEETRSWPPR